MYVKLPEAPVCFPVFVQVWRCCKASVAIMQIQHATLLDIDEQSYILPTSIGNPLEHLLHQPVHIHKETHFWRCWLHPPLLSSVQQNAWEQNTSPQNRQTVGSVKSLPVLGHRLFIASSTSVSKCNGSPTNSNIDGCDSVRSTPCCAQCRHHPEIIAHINLQSCVSPRQDAKISSRSGSLIALDNLLASVSKRSSNPVLGKRIP